MLGGHRRHSPRRLRFARCHRVVADVAAGGLLEDEFWSDHLWLHAGGTQALGEQREGHLAVRTGVHRKGDFLVDATVEHVNGRPAIEQHVKDHPVLIRGEKWRVAIGNQAERGRQGEAERGKSRHGMLM